MTNSVRALVLILASGGLGSWSCGSSGGPPPVEPFLADANATLLKLGIEAGQASWVYSTYITNTEASMRAGRPRSSRPAFRQRPGAASGDARAAPPVDLLKLSSARDTGRAEEAEEVTESAPNRGDISKGKWCRTRPSATCAGIGDHGIGEVS
jgi:hypothetical protein